MHLFTEFIYKIGSMCIKSCSERYTVQSRLFKKGLLHKDCASLSESATKITDQNLALSVLSSAPTSTITDFGMWRRVSPRRAREEEIVGAGVLKEEQKAVVFSQICSAFGACPWWGSGADPVYQPDAADGCTPSTASTPSSPAWRYAILDK